MDFIEFDADCMTDQPPGKRWRREVEVAAREYLQDAGFPLAAAEILTATGAAWLCQGSWTATRVGHHPQFNFADALDRHPDSVLQNFWGLRRRMVEDARRNRLRRGLFRRIP